MIKPNYIIAIFIGSIITCLSVKCPAQQQTDPTLFDPLIDVTDLIQKHYVIEVDDTKIAAAAINGMLHELDPYSEYIPAAELTDYQKRTSGSYEGIGIVIDIKEGRLTVISPFEDSPAYNAGILPGDIITEVDGQSTKNWSATRAIKALTGPAGQKVKIKVRHRNGDDETISIIRRRIHVPTLRGWRRNTIDGAWDYMLDQNNKVAYLRLTQFTTDTVEEFDQVMSTLRDQQINALIIDLRNNPGGIMSAAVDLADRMLDQGVIVTTRGAHSPTQTKYAKAQGTYPRFHLVVLINRGSASAAEIVAGALQDHNRAVIVGERSWGKGSVQRFIRLPDSGAAVKLTTDYYYLPKGRCVHRIPGSDIWGVEPDIEEKLDPDKIEKLRDLLATLVTSPAQENQQKDYSPPDTAQDAKTKETLAAKLLQLDSQLDQALKQCKGLIRTRPTLQAITESFSE